MNTHGGGSGDFNRRLPVPSSRKFTPTPVKSQVMQKLFKDDRVNRSKKSRKSKSVAEITPTKTVKYTRPKCASNTPLGLHATPRPLIFEETPSRRTITRNSDEELKLKASWLIYRRMLLYTWRRTRERLIMLHESFRRRQELISQLEMQVDVLKTLRKSESERCENFMVEKNSLSIKFEFLLNDYESLKQTNWNLKQDLDINRQRYLNEIENQKNEILTKCTKIEQLETDLAQTIELLQMAYEKETILNNKLTTQHSIITSDRESMKSLKRDIENLENTKIRLFNEQKNDQQKYEELSSKYENLTVDYDVLKDHLYLLNRNMEDLINKNKRKCSLCYNFWIFVRMLSCKSFYKKIVFLMLPAVPPF